MTTSHPDAEDLLAHAAFVRSMAHAALGGDEAVDDVVQETWLAALKHGRLRLRSPRSWLAAVVRRQAALEIRSRQRERRRVTGAAERMGHAGGSSPSEIAERVEAGRSLAAAVLALPEAYRDALLLRYYDDLPPREVAKRLGVPVETARTRVRRGLDLLRARLEQERGRDWRALLLPLAREGMSTTGLALGAGVMAKKILLATVVLFVLVGGTLWLRPWERRGPAEADAQPPPAADAAPARDPHLAGRADVARLRAEGRLAPPVDFDTVDRTRDLHGVIVDPDGDPVSGAKVQAVHFPWRRSGLTSDFAAFRERRTGPQSTSAADGSFALRLEPGDLVWLRVTTGDGATIERARYTAGERVRFVLSPAVRVVVEVRTPEGRPAADLGVGLFTLRRSSVEIDRRTVTDEDGRAVFDGLPPGVRALVEVDVGEGRAGHAGVTPVTTPERGEVVLRIEMPEGRTIRGRVTSRPTGEPIPGAQVSIAWIVRAPVETDADGRYELHGWTGKDLKDVRVVAPGHARARRAVGDRTELDFQLEPDAVVTGRVVDHRGRALAGARVNAMGAGPGSGADPSFSWTTSGPEGEFRLEGLSRYAAHVVEIRARGHARVRVVAGPSGEARERDVGDVMLPAPCVVHGRALGGDGAPLVRETVALVPMDDASKRIDHRTRIERPTDDLGRFSFVDVAPGPYVLHLERDRRSVVSREIDVGPDDRSLEVDLGLEPPPELVERLVRVVDLAGRGIEEATVLVYPDGKPPLQQARTDARGEARVRVAAHDRWKLSVSVPPRIPYHGAPFRWVEAGETEPVAVVLEPAAVVMGTLRGPDGRPVVMGTVHITYADGTTSSAWTDRKDGTFWFKHDPDGRVDLRFEGDVIDIDEKVRVRKPWAAELLGIAADSRDVELVARALPTDRRMTIRLVGPDGGAVSGVGLALASRGGEGPAYEGVTDARGEATFGELPALHFRLSVHFVATRERPWLLPETEEVVPDDQDVVIAFRAGEVVEGVLRKVDGSPASGAFLLVYVDDDLRQVLQCDQQGRFTVPFASADASPVTLRTEARIPSGGVVEARLENVRPGDGPVDVQFREKPPPSTVR